MPHIGNDIALAVRHLRAGRLVAFPTETVYGLGGDAANRDAIAEIYRLKDRPTGHPLIVHLFDFADADEWAQDISPPARRLARRFMPGPLTLVLPRRSSAPFYATGDDSIALRVPMHKVARKLLADFAGGIAAPSANGFGRLSPTRAVHVAEEFAAADLYVLNGGDCPVGIESVIVDCREERLFLLRPGAIAEAELSLVAGQQLLAPPPTARAPGLLPRHYAPLIPLFLVSSEVVSATTGQTAVLSRQKPAAVLAKFWRKTADAPAQYAHELYRLLRELEMTGAGMIRVEMPPTKPPWQAVYDRLRRAATT